MKISVVVPVLNEERNIDALIQRINASNPFEIILSDGGSTDQTVEKAKKYPGVKVITAARGRSSQMNAGAEAASGDTFFFLHADSMPPLNYAELIDQALRRNRVKAGSFRIYFDDNSLWMNSIAWLCWINIGMLTFGDQGLFMRAKTFHEIGGFPDVPIFEDRLIQKPLRRRGKFVKLKQNMITSARRFHKNGPIYNQIRNVALVLALEAGIRPRHLAKFYT